MHKTLKHLKNILIWAQHQTIINHMKPQDPYRYQYSYTANRQQRVQPPKSPKNKRGGIKLAVFVFILAVVAIGWITLKPGNAVGDIAKSVSKSVDKKPEPPKPTLDSALQAKLNTWAAAHDGDFGISVREINGKMRYGSYQADKSFVPASTFKPFVAYTILNTIQQGGYSLQATTYKGNTIQYCMERMILISDNDCAYQLERKAHFGEMDTFLQAQGFKNTTLNNYDSSGHLLTTDKHTTASDEAELLWRLHKGTLLNPANTDYLLGLMKKQQWRERIPAGVPDGVVVADKPGWLPGIEADMGIIYGTKSTYVITVISTGATKTTLADLSKVVYDYLNPTTIATTNP
jgi:beta-lactamase class A